MEYSTQDQILAFLGIALCRMRIEKLSNAPDHSRHRPGNGATDRISDESSRAHGMPNSKIVPGRRAITGASLSNPIRDGALDTREEVHPSRHERERDCKAFAECRRRWRGSVLQQCPAKSLQASDHGIEFVNQRRSSSGPGATSPNPICERIGRSSSSRPHFSAPSGSCFRTPLSRALRPDSAPAIRSHRERNSDVPHNHLQG